MVKAKKNKKKKTTDTNESIFVFDLALIRLWFYVNNALPHVVVHEFFNYGGSSLALHLWLLAGPQSVGVDGGPTRRALDTHATCGKLVIFSQLSLAFCVCVCVFVCMFGWLSCLWK